MALVSTGAVILGPDSFHSMPLVLLLVCWLARQTPWKMKVMKAWLLKREGFWFRWFTRAHYIGKMLLVVA